VAIPSWQLAEGYTQSANSGATWARTPALFVGIHGINDLTSWNAYDTVGVGGGPAAGVGWSHARFAQRLREVFWRVKANCPTCELWMLTQAPSDAGDTAANRPVFADINAAIIQACSDPTVNANVADVSLVLGKQNGGATLYGTDDAHPNATGHLLVADAFMAAYRRKHTELYGRTGIAIF
jgi:lysophospholipase L1-like esterase